ncbi:translocation/assembly module TamB domain-containing protein [Polaribacter sp. Z014]|uniref:translocation/assembly module TamB domain-containing protein n=1 Tax=Polaribacter sp. Z014 TaxID=2927126 RepID=UPI002020DBCF|nr:translocation/assembly module TamB [Polaribacter sp. Z014]MCL7762469.1 translocation/assembly module TamB domain-containing protein [Polaribacter sp. Z014]
MILFIRSPWGQSIIVDKAINYVTGKTNTKITVDKLFLTFKGGLQLDGLYVEDTKGDTLLYSKSLEANLPLWGMIKGGAVGVDNLEWNGLRANIIRKDSLSGYNFQFLIDAFASEEPTPVVEETTSEPIDIVLGNINLSKINVVFKDDVIGIDSHFKIGYLTANMDKVDLRKMIFNADEISLSDTNIKLIQKTVAQDTTTTASVLPFLSANKISLNKVKAYYENPDDKLIVDVYIDDFYTEIPGIDLSTNKINLTTLQLKNADILLKTVSTNSAVSETTTNNTDFVWPDFEVQIDDINIENNKIQYFVNNEKVVKNTFNPNAIVLENLTLKVADIFLKDRKAGLQLNAFNFEEKSGFNLKEFALNTKLSDNEFEVSDINIQIDKNKISGFTKANYKSISQLISSPEKTNIQLKIPSFSLWLETLFKFQPTLKENEYINKLSKRSLTGTVNIDGSLADVNISNTNINWGNFTKISLDGNFKNVTDTDKLQLNISNFKAKTKRNDLLQIVDEKALGIHLPEDILITSNINGTLSNISTNTQIKTSQGIATIKGNFKNGTKINYTTDIQIENYNVGTLLMNPKFGELSITLNSKGSGKNIQDLDATLKTTISKFQLENYPLKDLNIEAELKNGKGTFSSNYKDDNLNLDLNANVNLDSINTKATVNLNLIGADLEALGIMQRKVKTGLKLSLDFKGNAESYTLKSNIKNGVAVYNNSTFLVGDFTANTFVDKDTTAVSIKNKMIDLNLESNTDPQTFSTALQRHVASYFYRNVTVSDTIKSPVNLKLKAKISQTPLLRDVFLVNLKDLDTINIDVDFKEKERKLIANITAPHINFSDNELDSLAFSMHTDKEDFNFNLGFKEITAGPLNVPKTIITGTQKDNELSLNFLGFYKGEKLMNVNTSITGNSDKLKFTIDKDSLLLNSNNWKIPKTNAIIFENDKLTFSDFKINLGNQSIEITDEIPRIANDHIAINYKNFEINEVFNYLSPEKEITTGVLNGDFILEQPFGDTGIIANLSISKLQVLKTDFGKLSVDAKSLENGKYDFNASLKEGTVDLDLKGDYLVENNDASLNLDLLINDFKMKALNTLSLGEIKETSGSFSGDFKVTGKTSDPKYKGSLHFTNAAFKVAKLNAKFNLKDETLQVDNSGFNMSNFTILDAEKNALVVSGDIKTKSFINPTFNLDIKANKFRVLNATKEDNESLYGKVSFNVDAKLTGNLQVPKLNAKLVVGSDTDVTYVLPSSYTNIEEREGVVAFVNRENPDAILTQKEEQTATVTGFDVKAFLKIDKKAAVKVIIDKNTGDNFKVSGDGDFIFQMTPNGRLSLTGAYEVASGHYELNLYNVVDRKFVLVPGSRISWSGDPFDAKLDIRTTYTLKTSASDIMASQISGEDSSTKNKYKQVLPFNVYLNIGGELLQPKISFNLDMPEEQQGAIGGQVYERVQQVNQQEDELNKQVFSLLVLSRFYPDTSSDGSSGGFATIARNNLNDAVSGQLNAFSDKILGGSGIELDFGLNSFTDYQGDAPTDRTQLDVAAQKKLFNDRLTVRVGSEVDIQGSSSTEEKSPLIGNVSLEYKITEDGRYRLKGFRKSEFENVIDGQIIVNGIALIFTKEFNEFQQLWNSILRSKKEKENTNKKENKTAPKTSNADNLENKK